MMIGQIGQSFLGSRINPLCRVNNLTDSAFGFVNKHGDTFTNEKQKHEGIRINHDMNDNSCIGLNCEQ